MTTSRWYLAKGCNASRVFYTPFDGASCWTSEIDRAFRFVDRDDATHTAECLMLVGGDDPIAIVMDCPKARQQDEAKQQHRDAKSLDYIRRAMTARDVRHGPGPDRDVVHGEA